MSDTLSFVYRNRKRNFNWELKPFERKLPIVIFKLILLTTEYVNDYNCRIVKLNCE